MANSLAAHDDLAIGVDIGGTKVAAGLVNSRGEILYRTRSPMVCSNGAESGLAAVTKTIDNVLAHAQGLPSSTRRIDRLGVCSPGPLDPKAGIVLNPPNVPCWRNFPLAQRLAEAYRVRVTLDNDANAAGIAEAIWGAGCGYSSVFYATVGTGIGTAILFDRRIYHGRTGAAAEAGHMSIDYRGPLCGCGKHGCIEALASGPAIAKRAQDKLRAGARSMLLEMAGTLESVSSEMVGDAYTAGDAVARQVLTETIEMLTVWLGNVIDILEPDAIVIGGGVATMVLPFLSEIKERLPSACVNQRCQEIPIMPARYGEDAGVVGGAALCVGALK